MTTPQPRRPARWRRLAALTLTAAALGAALSACAPLIVGGALTGALVASDRRTSGAQLEDQGIEFRASGRLREVLGDRGSVAVTSYNRQVLLTGEVNTEQDKALVERTVAAVENVRAVVNEVGVQARSTVTQLSSDTLMTGRVKASLIDARDITGSAFKVVTTRGTVYLMGRVTQREADRATEIARNVQGVRRVVRVLEIITEEELARVQPRPAANER
ncbi:MAG: BON domain-containing protein [Hydrogenophaga sp.]|jgi:osmotically-inducible protein OsmY|nr:BON domain-containing protein [Hydrogenophaga sp.]